MSQHEIYRAVDRIPQATLPKRAFKEAEAAFYLGVSRSFLRQARMDSVREKRTSGPPYIKMGRMIRYLREELDIWIDQYREEVSEDGN